MEGTKIGSFLFFFFPKFEILRNKWKAKKNFEESKKPSKNVLKNNNSIRDSSKGFILGGFLNVISQRLNIYKRDSKSLYTILRGGG